MSTEREILEYLLKNKNKKTFYYKGIKVGLFGLPSFKHYKYHTLANCASSLKRKGYIIKSKNNSTYFITHKGESFLQKLRNKKPYLRSFLFDKRKSDPKDLLIIYDIPEEKKKERDWFRRQLVSMNFLMIQRSVWVGPGPLQKDFLEYLKEIGLDQNFKTFKLAKGYNI